MHPRRTPHSRDSTHEHQGHTETFSRAATACGHQCRAQHTTYHLLLKGRGHARSAASRLQHAPGQPHLTITTTPPMRHLMSLRIQLSREPACAQQARRTASSAGPPPSIASTSSAKNWRHQRAQATVNPAKHTIIAQLTRVCPSLSANRFTAHTYVFSLTLRTWKRSSASLTQHASAAMLCTRSRLSITCRRPSHSRRMYSLHTRCTLLGRRARSCTVSVLHRVIRIPNIRT